jgi:hypothetical protein
MPYTRHGHWYGADDPTTPPDEVAQCGGPALCPDCALDAHRGEEGAPVHPIISNPNTEVSYLATAQPLVNPGLTTTTYTVTSPSPPRVGQSVHYMSEGSPVLADGTQKYRSLCRAAIITQVAPGNPTLLGLCVLNPAGMFFNVAVPLGEGREPGSWHWPDHT